MNVFFDSESNIVSSFSLWCLMCILSLKKPTNICRVILGDQVRRCMNLAFFNVLDRLWQLKKIVWWGVNVDPEDAFVVWGFSCHNQSSPVKNVRFNHLYGLKYHLTRSPNIAHLHGKSSGGCGSCHESNIKNILWMIHICYVSYEIILGFSHLYHFQCESIRKCLWVLFISTQ